MTRRHRAILRAFHSRASRTDASVEHDRREDAERDQVLPERLQLRALQHDGAQRDDEIARRDRRG